MGHHWWGDMLSPLLHNHMWIKEGFAEYSSHLFEELLSGREAFVEMVKDNQQFVLEQAHIDDLGFWALSPIPDAEIYGRHSYNKGASVVHNLRNYLGDDLFRSGGQAVLATHYGGAMDDVMLEAAWEEATGVDLTPWFDAHIRQPGFSTWVLDSTSTMGLGARQGRSRRCTSSRSCGNATTTMRTNPSMSRCGTLKATGKWPKLWWADNPLRPKS